MIEETKNHFISDSDIKHVISDTERLVIILFVTDGNAYSILMESGLRNLKITL